MTFATLVLSSMAMTILAAVASVLCGFPLALMVLVLRTSRNPVPRYIAAGYVSIIRGTPALLLVLVAYYVVPATLDMNLPALAAGILALALNTAAFLSEVLRGALATIPAGQRFAARALGMSRLAEWRHVVLPQVIYRALPPLTSEFGIILKATSLLSVISVPEMTALSREMSNTTHKPLLVYGATAAAYFTILFITSTASRRLEARVARYLPHAA